MPTKTKEGTLFGLDRGYYLTAQEIDAILFAMDWDGVRLTPEGASIPYKLMKEWFATAISVALEEAVAIFEANHGQPLVVLQGEHLSEANEQEALAQSA